MKFLTITFLAAAIVNANSQGSKTNPPGLSAITEADLKRDLFAMADDHFRGRSAGTLDELKASAWWAEQMRAAGLKPAGDDGTFFQFFTLKRNIVDSDSRITIGGRSLELWKDVLVAQTAPAIVSAPLKYLGPADKIDFAKLDVTGQAVVVQAVPTGISNKISLPEWRYHRSMMSMYGSRLIEKGAAAIVFISDDFAEHSWDQQRENLKRGLYDIEGGVNARVTPKAPVLWLRKSANDWIQSGGSLIATINVVSFDYPSVNIIGKIDGTDPQLSQEYVLFSAHQDAHGIRNPVGSDTVYRGADDNASVAVAMLAVGRAFKKSPARRSALLVVHGAEERGLLGSRYFSAHPTVPISSIVAVLNGDMIGRNHPDSAALLGMKPPHRNSSDLVTMALDANNEGPKFKLDSLWDKPSHNEFWYFRSDHLPYARLGIPALMYSTLLHPDYHTPMDEAKRINYSKLKKMTEWIYRTGWKAANAAKRPASDPGFKLER
jgi:hypothetical protein